MKAKKTNEKKLKELTQELPVELTNEELLARGRELAMIEQRIRDEDTHAGAVKRDLKARMGNLEVERSRLASIVRNKHEPRPVLCEGWARYSEGVYEEVRTDTGELVLGSRRRLGPDEMQESLFVPPEQHPAGGHVTEQP